MKLSVRRRFALYFHRESGYPLPLCLLLLQEYENLLLFTLANEGVCELSQLGRLIVAGEPEKKHLRWENSAELVRLMMRLA